VEHLDGGVARTAARDRTVAAVVDAFGRGAIDEVVCSELLDVVLLAGDVAHLDAVYRDLSEPSSLGPTGLASGVLGLDTHGGGRTQSSMDAPLWLYEDGPTEPAAAVHLARADISALPIGSQQKLPIGTQRELLIGTPQTGLVGMQEEETSTPSRGQRRLDPVDLALAARARSSAVRRRDPRMVSLAVVVVTLVVLIVLGLILLSAVRSHISGTVGHLGSEGLAGLSVGPAPNMA